MQVKSPGLQGTFAPNSSQVTFAAWPRVLHEKSRCSILFFQRLIRGRELRREYLNPSGNNLIRQEDFGAGFRSFNRRGIYPGGWVELFNVMRFQDPAFSGPTT